MSAVPSPHYLTLVANTVATVDFTPDFSRVEVLLIDGVADVWFRVDGVDPVVGGDGCHLLKAGAPGALTVDDQTYARGSQVRLVSPGTPKVSVRGVVSGERQLGGC